MIAYDIDWDVDKSELYELLETDERLEKASELFKNPACDFSTIPKEDRITLFIGKFHNCPGALYDFLGLPESVELPNELSNEEDITNWLSDTYGYCFNSYRLDSDSEVLPDTPLKISDIAKEVEEWMDFGSVPEYQIDSIIKVNDFTYRVNVTESHGYKYYFTVKCNGRIISEHGEDCIALCENAYDNDPEALKFISEFKKRWYR